MWRDTGIKGYQVSSHGRVKSSRKLLTQTSVGRGYLRVSMGRNNYDYVHRIVARAFIRNSRGCREVNHKNGVKTDNRVENLEWVTTSENQKHAYRILGRSPTRQFGNGHARKLTETEVTGLRELKSKGWKNKDLAQKYGVTEATVRNVYKRRTYDKV